jgi:hypothetical protein
VTNVKKEDEVCKQLTIATPVSPVKPKGKEKELEVSTKSEKTHFIPAVKETHNVHTEQKRYVSSKGASLINSLKGIGVIYIDNRSQSESYGCFFLTQIKTKSNKCSINVDYVIALKEEAQKRRAINRRGELCRIKEIEYMAAMKVILSLKSLMNLV